METPEPGRVTLTHRAGVTGVRCGVRPGSVLGGGHHRRSLGGGHHRGAGWLFPSPQRASCDCESLMLTRDLRDTVSRGLTSLCRNPLPPRGRIPCSPGESILQPKVTRGPEGQRKQAQVTQEPSGKSPCGQMPKWAFPSFSSTKTICNLWRHKNKNCAKVRKIMP